MFSILAPPIMSGKREPTESHRSAALRNTVKPIESQKCLVVQDGISRKLHFERSMIRRPVTRRRSMIAMPVSSVS